MKYNTITTITTITNKLQHTYLYLFDDGELQVFFEGTTGLLQWLYNFLFWPFLYRKPYKDMPVKFYCHYGFHKCYKSVRDQIMDYIKINDEFITRITIYGVSHGATAAYAMIEDLSFNYYEKSYSGIFSGSPKWLTKKGRDIFSKRCYGKSLEYQQGNDIVNKVAPGYHNSNMVIHYGKKKRWYKMSINDHRIACQMLWDKKGLPTFE